MRRWWLMTPHTTQVPSRAPICGSACGRAGRGAGPSSGAAWRAPWRGAGGHCGRMHHSGSSAPSSSSSPGAHDPEQRQARGHHAVLHHVIHPSAQRHHGLEAGALQGGRGWGGWEGGGGRGEGGRRVKRPASEEAALSPSVEWGAIMSRPGWSGRRGPGISEHQARGGATFARMPGCGAQIAAKVTLPQSCTSSGVTTGRPCCSSSVRHVPAVGQSAAFGARDASAFGRRSLQRAATRWDGDPLHTSSSWSSEAAALMATALAPEIAAGARR